MSVAASSSRSLSTASSSAQAPHSQTADLSAEKCENLAQYHFKDMTRLILPTEVNYVGSLELVLKNRELTELYDFPFAPQTVTAILTELPSLKRLYFLRSHFPPGGSLAPLIATESLDAESGKMVPTAPAIDHQLTHLGLPAGPFPGSDLVEAAANAKHLTNLQLDLSPITNPGLLKIWPEMGKPSDFSDQNLMELVEKCSKLKELNLIDPHHLSEKGLKAAKTLRPEITIRVYRKQEGI